MSSEDMHYTDSLLSHEDIAFHFRHLAAMLLPGCSPPDRAYHIQDAALHLAGSVMTTFSTSIRTRYPRLDPYLAFSATQLPFSILDEERIVVVPHGNRTAYRTTFGQMLRAWPEICERDPESYVFTLVSQEIKWILSFDRNLRQISHWVSPDYDNSQIATHTSFPEDVSNATISDMDQETFFTRVMDKVISLCKHRLLARHLQDLTTTLLHWSKESVLIPHSKYSIRRNGEDVSTMPLPFSISDTDSVLIMWAYGSETHRMTFGQLKSVYDKLWTEFSHNYGFWLFSVECKWAIEVNESGGVTYWTRG